MARSTRTLPSEWVFDAKKDGDKMADPLTTARHTPGLRPSETLPCAVSLESAGPLLHCAAGEIHPFHTGGGNRCPPAPSATGEKRQKDRTTRSAQRLESVPTLTIAPAHLGKPSVNEVSSAAQTSSVHCCTGANVWWSGDPFRPDLDAPQFAGESGTPFAARTTKELR